jgi:choline dehydrogenase-like flavoprotein
MVLDYNRFEDGSQVSADVCIIGGGAAGIAIALEFVGTKHDVLLLEAGGERPDAKAQRLYDTEPSDLEYRSAQEGRAVVLGGTTTLWAGQVLPLDALDFEQRDWVPESGWPWPLRTLAPYYRRAERLLGVPASSYDEASWPEASPRPPLVDRRHLSFRYSQFSPRPDFAAAFRSRLAAASNIRVLLHAGAVHITTRSNGAAVEKVEIRNLAGRSGSVTARHYVVCCGGIESARLLLVSNRVESGGLGNRHDLLGRYFQDHAHVKLRVRPAERRAFQTLFNTRRVGGVRCYPKIAATSEVQREHKTLNVGADACYEIDENSAVESAKLLFRAVRQTELRTQAPRALARVFGRPHELVGAAHRTLVLKQKASEGVGPVYMCIQCETLPNRDSRVLLGRSTDALGVPRVAIDWRMTELEKRTVELFARMLGDEFSRNGVGELDLSGLPLPSDARALRGCISPGHHHLGTTRMHADPRHGVVDPDCRVHGLANLHIASGSVFPTGGYSNPTLTILALSLRLADRLKESLR